MDLTPEQLRDISRLLARQHNDTAQPEAPIPPHQRIRLGATAPDRQVEYRLHGGLWVPASSAQGASPIDFIGQYLTWSDIQGTELPWSTLTQWLASYSKIDLLTACSQVLRKIHEDPAWAGLAADEVMDTLREDLASRGRSLIKDGRTLFTRHGILVLAKLSIAFGGEETISKIPLDITLGIMNAAIHDHLAGPDPDPNEKPDFRFGSLPPSLSASIVANQWFNRSFDEANFFTLYETRWIDDQGRQKDPLRLESFKAARGYDLDDQTAVALTIWVGVRSQGYVIFERRHFEALDLDSGIIDAILDHLSIGLADAALEVASVEILENNLAWNFDTFERFPLIRISQDNFLVLETSYLVRRCLGWAPIYDLETGRSRSEHGLAKSTEDYALDVLLQLYEKGPTSRVFNGDDLRNLLPEAKSADAAIDFGQCWVVIEVTARRPLRNMIHGASAQDLDEQLGVILEEIEQVAGTARTLQTQRHRLTGGEEDGAIRIYPIVLMSEGFPTGPITLSAIRQRTTDAELFVGINAAPVEVIDLVELEMIESIVESGGPTLPDLLDAKTQSNFWSDSLRNYLISRKDLHVLRPKRVSEVFSEPLDRLAKRLRLTDEERASVIEGRTLRTTPLPHEADDPSA